MIVLSSLCQSRYVVYAFPYFHLFIPCELLIIVGQTSTSEPVCRQTRKLCETVQNCTTANCTCPVWRRAGPLSRSGYLAQDCCSQPSSCCKSTKLQSWHVVQGCTFKLHLFLGERKIKDKNFIVILIINKCGMK